LQVSEILHALPPSIEESQTTFLLLGFLCLRLSFHASSGSANSGSDLEPSGCACWIKARSYEAYPGPNDTCGLA
jgi:hypothetical protein